MNDKVTETSQAERRAPRHKTYQGAKIIVNNASTFSCVIKSRSSTGFGLKLGSTSGVPNRFSLRDEKTDKVYNCEVVWRKHMALGVKIIDEATEETPT